MPADNLLMDIEGLKPFFEGDSFNAFQQQSTDVKTREKIGRSVLSNMTVDRGSEFDERMREIQYQPAYLYENERRRQFWAPLFTSEAYKGRKNALLRRGAEIVLDNVWTEIRRQYADIAPHIVNQHPIEFLMENTSTSNIASFVTVALAQARRLIPAMLFRSLFQVIPVTQPDVKVPFYKRKYDTTVVGGATADTEIHPYAGSNFDPYFAGARVYGEQVGEGDAIETDFDLDRHPTYDHVVYVDGVEQTLTTDYTIGDGTGAGGVDQILLVVAPADGAVIECTYDVRQESDAANKVTYTMELLDVTGEEMTLAHIWSLKSEQDAAAYYRLNMMAENPAMLSEELYQAFDAAVLTQVLNQAGGTQAIFDASGYLPGDTTSQARHFYDKKIYHKMIEASQSLFATHRQWPTYFVGGVGITTRLMKLEEFTAAPQAQAGLESNTRAQIQQRVLLGTIGDRWTVYQSPRLADTQGFFGWPAINPFRSNYVITIFMPFFITPRVWNQTLNLESGQAAQARVGRRMIDDTQFATMAVTT